jgi:hypothetical protein
MVTSVGRLGLAPSCRFDRSIAPVESLVIALVRPLAASIFLDILNVFLFFFSSEEA